MKRNPINIIAGLLLICVFGLLLFVFQVRKSEVAVVTRFGKPTRTRVEPGPYLKWPWPIEKVYKLDQRIQTLEGTFEETLTADGMNLIVEVYVGWNISEPASFFPKFADGSVEEAARSLSSLVNNAKNEVITRHPFSHFVSTDEKEVRFDVIEQEMLAKVRDQLSTNQYGIDVKFIGIKRLGLPETVTKAVFQRMEKERESLVRDIQAKGQTKAVMIKADADRESAERLAKAEAEATRIRGEGEAMAAESFAVFNQNTNLASLLFQLRALEAMLKEKSTLVLDPTTPGLNLLQLQPPRKP